MNCSTGTRTEKRKGERKLKVKEIETSLVLETSHNSRVFKDLPVLK